MAILNITLNGMSADLPQEVEYDLDDADVRRVALEVVRSGSIPGLRIAHLPANTFSHYVVDRFNTPQGGKRIYLRPKVPFGGSLPQANG